MSIKSPVNISPRYQRHIALRAIGPEGQLKLNQSSVLLIGAGGLGSPAALYLAAAGVGRLGIVDDDKVDLTNLQRQILHGTRTIGHAKAHSAAERIADLNPEIAVEPHPVRLTKANVDALVKKYDVVVDGSDNFATRYLVNDTCVRAGKPYVYGSVSEFEGQAAVFGFRDGGCYRCLFPEPPAAGLAPNCAETGVLGVLPGIIGTIQATEALKVLLGIGEPLVNRLLLLDVLTMKFRELKWKRDPACPVCGTQPATTLEKESVMQEITATELKKRLDAGEDLMVIDVREPHELAVCSLPGAWSIPLAQVVARANEIDENREVVMMCKAGGRSAMAIANLRHAGYKGKLLNLKGGILAWADEVDPNLAKY